MNFQNGDIVLYRHKSLIAFLVRLFTGFKYNHAGIYCNGSIYESDRNGVQVSTIQEAFKNVSRYCILRPKQKQPLCPCKMATAYYDNKNIRYDYINLIFYQIPYRLFGIWLGKRTIDRMTCAEYIACCFPALYSAAESDKVSAKELYSNPAFDVVYEGQINIS